MLPETRQDRSALHWIRGELDQTLREARTSLEDFVEGQRERLNSCVDLLHHVHGALEMVQVYGAAMLADEMEQLAIALGQGRVGNAEAAAEALMLGMVQLPAYLERIESGGADVPLALLPVMNDLRSAQGAPLVSETSLFAPKLNAVIAAETVRPGSGNRELPHFIHRRRSQFHRGLLSWIRGQDVKASLAQIRDVFDELHGAAGTARFRRLMDAAEALASALLDDEDAPSPAVKPLFGQVDKVLKQVMDRGEEQAMLDFPTDLLKNLLYYIARSPSTAPSVLAVKRAADLVNSFPDSAAEGGVVGALGGPDRELFQAVGEALAQDLRDVKDRLDLYIRSDRSQLERLIGLVSPIQRIADTLGMVGRGDLRTQLKHRCDELRDAEQNGAPPAEDRLMTLAEDLLLVESSLTSLASSGVGGAGQGQSAEGAAPQSLSEGELKQHQRSAIDEALVELAKTKDDILEYLDRTEHPELLADVPSRLHVVSGVLQMLELPEAADLLNRLRPYIASLATGQTGAPDAAQRDALADVVISAELYMESATEPGRDRGKLLHHAEAALDRLGLSGSVEQPARVQSTAERAGPEADEVAVPPLEEQVLVSEAVSPGVESALQPDAEAGTEQETAAAVGPEAEAAPETATVDEVDSEILEVFGEEAEEQLGVIEDCYPKWREHPDDRESLQTMRRSFHTLKGSGRMVGANNIGEFSWAIENLLNRVIDGTVAGSSEVLGLMDEAVAVLPALVAESREPGTPGTDVSALAERAFAVAAGEDTAAGSTTSPSADTVQPVPVASAETEGGELPAGQPGAGAVALYEDEGADESILTAVDVQDSDFAEFESVSSASGDSSLNAVFLNEAQGHLDVLGHFVQRFRGGQAAGPLEEGVRRAMHTLHGSARTAGIRPMAELAAALEEYGNVVHAHHRDVDGPAIELLDRSHHALTGLVAGLEDPQLKVPDWEALRDELAAVTADLLHGASASATGQAVGREASVGVEAEAPATEMDKGVDPELLEVFLDEARELLEAMDAELTEWATAGDNLRPVAQLQRTLHTMKGGARLAGVAAVGDLSHALESVFESLVERRIEAGDRLKSLVRDATDLVAQDVDRLVRGSMPAAHPAMIERLEAAAKGQDWDELATLDVAVEEERRAEAAAWAMEAESQFLGGEMDADSELRGVDESAEDSELLDDSQLMIDSELLGESGGLPQPTGAAASGPVGAVVSSDSTVVQFPGGEQLADGEGFVARRPLPEEPPAPAVSSERVRVSSDVLDQMVNNAGEVSIYRSRLEQQNSSFEFNLNELGQTIERLRGQLRKLELETEAQILSRHEREAESLADFDPLEMDRYSTIQQLSRALSETVEDLSNLGHTLSDLSRDTDTLLLQQARVTTDLQDSLLRTRMVKFSSRVPRLERVVRQTSHSVGKQANLEVIGGEEDMDRTILERMMGPLEHLLRNAVSHGIEDADTRLAAGKAPQGLITLQLVREGTEVVLKLSDDGAGLDRERIRAKAEERGLLNVDADIEDDDLYQLILQPGFSTAQELSQVSGRGVGMDVVLTEVKQLGGTLEIDSHPGKGTTFTTRLPFTLAITDALLVTLGEDIFAVPHSSMDGVVRIPVDELRAVYAGEKEKFEYAGREYSVRYLGGLLGTQAPLLSEGLRWLPMLLVHSGDHRMAIQVDGLLGNRQIVVKSIGAQLSGVRWFSGGTILADGQIALILDTNTLIRLEGAQQAAPIIETAEPASKGVSVMVVDDSITVRKVTSRLLERHNMQVLTAKDGVDAVTLLQEHRPDVMLLDIEMPRMDGYELARHMRSTPELSDIPIIMITSRTGDKHRNRAIELGVKRYLGKPYQEAELLENIYTVLADTAL